MSISWRTILFGSFVTPSLAQMGGKSEASMEHRDRLREEPCQGQGKGEKWGLIGQLTEVLSTVPGDGALTGVQLPKPQPGFTTTGRQSAMGLAQDVTTGFSVRDGP